MPSIVLVSVSIQAAPIPPTLQATGAFISQGATDLTPGTFSLLTLFSDLADIIAGAENLSTITWSNTIVTATAASPHNLPIGDDIEITISGVAPIDYNGTFLCHITTTTAFTFELAANPGSMTTPGAYTLEDVSELNAQAMTFFAQGTGLAVYVLELGAGDPAAGVTALHDYITENPNGSYTPGSTGFFYNYLVPRQWSSEPTFLTFLANYEAPTSKTYFTVTGTLQNYTNYTDLMKDVILVIEAPKQHAWEENDLINIRYQTGTAAASATPATTQDGAGSYDIGEVLTAVGGTGTEPTFTVDSLLVQTVAAGTDGTGADGEHTFTGTTGVGTKFQFTGTIATNVLTPGGITVPGNYTVAPTDISNEPVTSPGCNGYSVVIKMGVLTVEVTQPGDLSAIPANPVTTTSDGSGTGATLTIDWLVGPDSGFIVAFTETAHGVSVGDWFQLIGNTPLGYNGYYQALIGTSGTELVAELVTDPGVSTIAGHLARNIAVSTGVPSTEFSAAAFMFRALKYAPSSTNKVAPYSFQFLFGVTPFPTLGKSSLLQTLTDANVNYVGTGAEGGISNTIIYWGRTMDGRQFNYWYSVDWAQINGQINVANAVINGSNNPLNPLYYNQAGIDRLQDTLVSTMNSAITFGLANGQVVATTFTGQDFDQALDSRKYDGMIVVNAVPFIPYSKDNPGDYRIGKYSGLSIQYIPQLGFQQIVFNIVVTDFIAG